MNENEKLAAQIKELVWENRIQTVAVVLVFFFGIATIQQLIKNK